MCCTCHLILSCINLPYSAARSVNITSDGLIHGDSRNFAQVQQPVSFQAVAVSSTELPPQTSYTWEVQDLQSSITTVVSSQETLTYSFPTFGEYLVSVTGSYMSTGSFYGSIGILAQSAYMSEPNYSYYSY